MKLPRQLLDSVFFVFEKTDDVAHALGLEPTADEIIEIQRLSGLGLPPVTSRDALAVMMGINPGLIWSFENRTANHYRHFKIPKGRGFREIAAPRVALKIVQKWLSVHLQKFYNPPSHVFGFVPGKSHIDAALVHCGAKWVYSVDIENFFPSTPIFDVQRAFMRIGYPEEGSGLLSRLCCLHGVLAQGAPTSPVISNIVFSELDAELKKLADYFQVKVTRYADDIVFSGENDFPDEIINKISEIFKNTPWVIAKYKSKLSKLPGRLKVHGLLVHERTVKLTKGYRNKIRAYAHLEKNGKIKLADMNRIRGHLKYSKYVDFISRRDANDSIYQEKKS